MNGNYDFVISIIKKLLRNGVYDTWTMSRFIYLFICLKSKLNKNWIFWSFVKFSLNSHNSWWFSIQLVAETVSNLSSALRVIPAVTRLTVNRRLQFLTFFGQVWIYFDYEPACELWKCKLYVQKAAQKSYRWFENII